MSCLVSLFLYGSMDLAHDVFGRERHRSHRDDMGGTGSIEKGCKTLYVGGLSSRSNIEEILWQEFSEWGEIEVWKLSFRCFSDHMLVNRVLTTGWSHYDHCLFKSIPDMF